MSWLFSCNLEYAIYSNKKTVHTQPNNYKTYRIYISTPGHSVSTAAVHAIYKLQANLRMSHIGKKNERRNSFSDLKTEATCRESVLQLLYEMLHMFKQVLF